MRRYLPELVALPMLPFLVAQGKYTRRVTPRLPEAGGPFEGTAGRAHPGAPLSLLAVGESPVAGVGVATHEEAITGQFARALAERTARPVRWRACGRNGVTAREALELLLPQVPAAPVDLALVAFGVNDTTAFRPVSHWRRDLHALLQALDARCRPHLIVLSGVPPMARFPALPQPLRWVMGLKAGVLDLAARELAGSIARTCHVPLLFDTADPGMMASDGYHPSAAGCAAWAQLLADASVAALAPDLRA
ncbi:MAG TPA: SGNH/GDSL hydrolase family protein [Noviherbaspirillum sp.]|uniref:SGNH/GDSL hydrolase family protein n=1 Tax=Noviherbaspirillum sp. TaxID=1926288 RepID=UPI002D715D00|nr:SGNH/GDSL hydrolase family protein [Noviherbaspirillum sp.]HYD95102.1 SGNH/GDSL hydrolase family protein [Noviherbaspirillum sp.]